jgi:hypothetical protein
VLLPDEEKDIVKKKEKKNKNKNKNRNKNMNKKKKKEEEAIRKEEYKNKDEIVIMAQVN